MSEPLTLEAMHRSVAKRLSAERFDPSGLEASLLLEYVTGLSRSEQIVNGRLDLPEKQIDQLETLLKRRLSGEPLDNILGSREFFGLKFRVTADVLSPRSETEMLVEYVLSQTKPDQSCRILDLGTGSGAISISILKSRENFEAVAVDLSDAALGVAGENAAMHDVDKRIEFLQGSWFEPVKGKFDFIISNPPYITDQAMSALSPEVSGYDPHLALSGGQDGLTAYHSIAEHGLRYLKPDGKLCLEIGYDQGQSVPDLLKQADMKVLAVLKDLSVHDRCVIACAASSELFS